MNENIQKRRHAITLVVLSLLLITPLLASAQVPNPRSGREIVERVFQRLCERGILRSSLCNPTPPPPPPPRGGGGPTPPPTPNTAPGGPPPPPRGAGGGFFGGGGSAPAGHN